MSIKTINKSLSFVLGLSATAIVGCILWIIWFGRNEIALNIGCTGLLFSIIAIVGFMLNNLLRS